MDILNGFAKKDMIEQIICLDEIKESRQVAAIPGLLDIYAHPIGDQAVDEMVYHTLFELLAGREQEIIAGFTHPSEAVRLLCVRRTVEGGSSDIKDALVTLLASVRDSELVAEILRALVVYQDAGLAETLLPYLEYEDYGVVAWAMRGLSGVHNDKVREVLMEIVSKSPEVTGVAAGCDLRIALAVENLARFNDEAAAHYLNSFIHHPNPSFRRVVLSAMAGMGNEALPALGQCLATGNKDEKIMAANVIGMAGRKQGADILIAQLEKTGSDPNLRFAIYEALGRIKSMRSVIGLADGLAETDELVLLAVINSLDLQCNQGVVKALAERIAKDDDQAHRLLAALITAHACHLFAALYQDELPRAALLKALESSANQEATEAFRLELEKIGSESALADMARLTTKEGTAVGKRILAADDSKAMLFFYRGAIADLGLDLVTVEDGRQALDLLLVDDRFDLIITDMNMPNMDGIELTRELRKKASLAQVPVLMATTESETSQVELARQAGVNDCITKPFSKEQFKAKLSEMLP